MRITLQMRHLALAALSLLVFFTACAEKKVKLWIEPPLGYESTLRPRNIYYVTHDMHTGKKESLAIPVAEPPDSLVIEKPGELQEKSGLSSATKADELLFQQTLPEPVAQASPTLSYLRGVDEVEALYNRQSFHEALIRLAPLLEQYPKQSKLFLMQGTLYRKLGEKKMAQQAFKRARELDKENPFIDEALVRTEEDSTSISGGIR